MSAGVDPVYVALEPGDTAPNFSQKSPGGTFNLGNLGGAFMALAVFPSSALGVGKAVLEIVEKHRAIFDGGHVEIIAVSIDRNDETRLGNAPGFHAVLDFDGKVARRYGAVPKEIPPGATRLQVRPRFLLTDKRLRVIAAMELRPDGSDAARILPVLESLPGLIAAEPELTPPVLVVPRVFPADVCRRLIGLFESDGGEETGVVRQTGETTDVVLDRGFKRRRDVRLSDPALVGELKDLLRRHLLPEIAKSFQFGVTHVERHIVSRYAAEERGIFLAHRDNYSIGTAYRRFACTINLNSDYEGGDLSFPEFGRTRFRASPGGAVVFSCSLLHAVSEMERGVRYAYLPFFYDDAAAKVLETYRASWSGDVEGPPPPELSRI